AHRDDIIAVHLLAAEACGNRFLSERLGCRLQFERHGNGPLIVVSDEYNGQLPHACKVYRLPDIALGCGAVAEQADRNARFLSKSEGVSYARGMRRLRSDRNAVGEIMRWTGGAIAALIAAPEQEDFLHL